MIKSLTTALFSLIASTCLATQFYVSPTGSNANNGTSPSTPCLQVLSRDSQNVRVRYMDADQLIPISATDLK